MKILSNSKWQSIRQKLLDYQELQDKYQEVKTNLTTFQVQNFDLQALVNNQQQDLVSCSNDMIELCKQHASKEKDFQLFYDKLFSLNQLVLNHKKIEYFSGMQEDLLNSFIEYLLKTKYEALQLYHKKTNDLDGIMFTNGVMSILDAMLKFFATAKAMKKEGMKEQDNITGDLVKWQDIVPNEMV